MNGRRKATLWGKVATVRYLTDSPSMLPEAAKIANEVFQDAAKTAWPLRLRARVHLAIAEDPGQGYTSAIDAAGEALSELGKAIEVRNYDGAPAMDELALRSRVYEVIGDPDSAIADIDLALLYDDRNSELRVRRGQLLQRLGAYDDARDEYNRAKSLDILSISPLIARAELEDSVGATEDAFVLLEEALQIDPHRYDLQERWWEVILRLAAKELERGHPEAVVDLLDEALQRNLGGQQVPPRRRSRSLMARVGLMRRPEAHAESRSEAEQLRRRAAFEVRTSRPT
jgi:tetratricopeptide (TPR) repeat protein